MVLEEGVPYLMCVFTDDGWCGFSVNFAYREIIGFEEQIFSTRSTHVLGFISYLLF